MPAVEIPLNPYQGLKQKITIRRGLIKVEIPLNPYQGLKLEILVINRYEFYVEIPLNPYQGLKPRVFIATNIILR